MLSAEHKRIVGVLAGLVLAVMFSAVGVVVSKHETRKLFIELQSLIAERDRLEVDWGRLQIEQSTWSTHARVEQLAREKMNMRDPAAGQVRLLVDQGGSE